MSLHSPESISSVQQSVNTAQSVETNQTQTSSERLIRSVHVPFSDEFQFALNHNMFSHLKTRPISKDGSSEREVLFNGRDLTRHNCWEEVRKGRCKENGSLTGTGWEGYFADVISSEERSIKLILIGKKMLQALKSELPFDPAMRTKYINALVKEQWSEDAMRFWNNVFGAEVSVNRSRVNQSPKLQAFRKETEQMVAGLPTPKVISNGNEIIHHYGVVKKPLLTFGSISLSEEDSLALALVKKSGILGSPVTRALLEARV